MFAALLTSSFGGWAAPTVISAGQPGVAAGSRAPAAENNAAAAAVVATEKAIAQFERRVAENPQDYLSFTVLGQLHARRARETGDLDSYRRAEEAFRTALDAKKDHPGAMLGLAAAFASQHKFGEARRMARAIEEASPGSVDALAVLGDASVEIGNYADADAAFQDLAIKAPDEPSVLARLAHLAELKGMDGQALQLLRRAADKELAEEGNGESSAWYQTRIGTLLYRTGKLNEASKSFEAALQLFDGYYIALDGLADVRNAQGRVDDAIAMLELAVTASGRQQPASLFALGDLYLKKGRTADAERVFQQAEAIAERPGSYPLAYRRELAMFYANHNRNLEKALDLARQDLEARPDIYGYDALAWALYKNNRFEEAAAAITKALALATHDPTLLVHAGLIEYRSGQPSQALTHLRSANALCPYLVTDEARRVLSELEAQRTAR
jgi:tetratricopeptide (TPR) repeat protein